MHTVMWTFQVPQGTSKQDLVNTINASAHTCEAGVADADGGGERRTAARQSGLNELPCLS